MIVRSGNLNLNRITLHCWLIRAQTAALADLGSGRQGCQSFRSVTSSD